MARKFLFPLEELRVQTNAELHHWSGIGQGWGELQEQMQRLADFYGRPHEQCVLAVRVTNLGTREDYAFSVDSEEEYNEVEELISSGELNRVSYYYLVLPEHLHSGSKKVYFGEEPEAISALVGPMPDPDDLFSTLDILLMKGQLKHINRQQSRN